MKNGKKILVSLLLGLTFIQPVNAASYRQRRFDHKACFSDFLKLYMRDAVALIAHELGHALTSYALAGANRYFPAGITIGTSEKSPKKQLFMIPERARTEGTRFAVNSIVPIGGYAHVKYRNNTPLKNAAINIAGPICGALTYYLFNMYDTYKIYKKHNITWTFKELLTQSLYSPDMLNELLINLIPYGENDGAKVFEHLFPGSKHGMRNNTYKLATREILAVISAISAIVMHQKLNQTPLGIKTGVYNKHFYEYIMRHINRYLMLLTHKSLAALRHGENTMFDEGDIMHITAMLVSNVAVDSYKELYMK